VCNAGDRSYSTLATEVRLFIEGIEGITFNPLYGY